MHSFLSITSHVFLSTYMHDENFGCSNLSLTARGGMGKSGVFYKYQIKHKSKIVLLDIHKLPHFLSTSK